MKKIDLSGQTLGGLYVIRKDLETTAKKQRAHYLCKCNHCGEEKIINSCLFRKKPPVSCGCVRAAGFTHPKARPGKKLERKLLHYAYRNAKRRGETSNLTVDDITIPDFCPVLGIKLRQGSGHTEDWSPSVDRIDPTKGYVKGNIWIISHKANRMKSNATLEEIGMLYEALKSLRKN